MDRFLSILHRARAIRSLAIAVSVLAVVAYVAFVVTQTVVIWRMQHDVNPPLDMFASAVLTPIDKYSYLPEIVASHPQVIAAVADKRNHAQLNQLLETMTDTARVEAIFVTDRTGMTVASSNWRSPQTFVGNNFSFRPYFQDAVTRGSGSFYGIGTVTYTPGYFLSHAIMSEGRVAGVVVVKIDLSNLDEKWNASLGYMTITDRNGIIFLSSKKSWKYRPLNPLAPQTLEKLRATRQYGGMLTRHVPLLAEEQTWQGGRVVRVQETTDTGQAVEGGRYVLRSDKLPGSDWTVSVFYSTDEVSSVALQVSAMFTVAFAFLALLLMYVQQVRKRIEEREAARITFEAAHRELEIQHQQLADLTTQLQVAAVTDPLTGAYNRRYFMEAVDRIDNEARRYRHLFTVMLLDIDHFKHINDRYGHDIGDEVLKEVTRVCRESLREADTFARFGGEEFVFALPNTQLREARVVAERLRENIAALTVTTAQGTLRITGSIGLSGCGHTGTSVTRALKQADEALYRAKDEGRNRIVVHWESAATPPAVADSGDELPANAEHSPASDPVERS